MVKAKHQDEERLEELKRFYKEAFDSSVNNLEYLFKDEMRKVHPNGFKEGENKSVGKYLDIFLKPVDNMRKPSSAKELKIMLLSILHCIKQLHNLG